MKKLLLFTLSLVSIGFFFTDCNKEGGEDINANKLEDKKWVALKTSLFLNGKEAGTVEKCVLFNHDEYTINDIYFSNGTATITKEDGKTFVYPYSVVNNQINIAGTFGFAISFNPVKLTSNELVAEYGSIEKTNETGSEPIEIANVNGIPIYHSIISNSSNPIIYYIDSNQSKVLCSLYPDGYTNEIEDFYHRDNFQINNLTAEQNIILMQATLRTVNYRYHSNFDVQPFIEQVQALGYSREESIFLLYTNVWVGDYPGDFDNAIQYFQNNKPNVPKLTKEFFISYWNNSYGGYRYFDFNRNCWEFYKVYAENSGKHWCDGIVRLYFTPK